MGALRQRGIPYVSVNLEPVWAPIDRYIPQLEAFIVQAERACATRPVLICHSMGGLVARAWLASNVDNLKRVGHVITIGSPHQGTWLARWSRMASGLQMRLNSTWLSQLREQEAMSRQDGGKLPFTCWYSNADNIVFPASVATLPGADNRFVPGVPHVALAFHPTVMRESLAMLSCGDNSFSDRTVS
jgi:triacylglycerol lipase